jgi:glycosyltransferase involved in cell wall biosynthesis
MARLATIGLSVPVVYTPHALSRSRWALAAERLLASRADRLIAVSESERAFMLAHRLAEERKIAVIPNGIELRPPPPLQTPLRDRLGIGAQTMLIGCVGRLTWQKAPEVFVSACSIMADRLPDAHFVLIGSGPLQSLVEKAIRVTGIENRFHLLPALPGAAAALPELDVYVLPSRFEGGPYTPMEAMRAGTAVVVTGVAGNRDLVEHWVSGLVVPPDEPYALATAVLTVLNDAGLRERLVSGARQSVKRFAVHSMAESTASLYRELSGRRSDSLAAG